MCASNKVSNIDLVSSGFRWTWSEPFKLIRLLSTRVLLLILNFHQLLSSTAISFDNFGSGEKVNCFDTFDTNPELRRNMKQITAPSINRSSGGGVTDFCVVLIYAFRLLTDSTSTILPKRFLLLLLTIFCPPGFTWCHWFPNWHHNQLCRFKLPRN